MAVLPFTKTTINDDDEQPDVGQTTITVNDDGTSTIDIPSIVPKKKAKARPEVDPNDFNRNLAEDIDDPALSALAAFLLEGIEAVKARLKVAGDGKPRLFICRDALVERDRALADAKRPVCTQDEILEYIWDDKAKKEQPRKENDHGMDAIRYLCAAVDLVGRPRVRFL